MRAVIAHSDEVDTVHAVDDLLAQCEHQLKGEEPKAALLFASVEYDHGRLLAAIDRRWPGLPLVGGSADGEISSEGGFAPDSALLTLLVGDDLGARVGLGRDLSQDPVAAIASATAEVDGGRPAVCISVFAPTADASAVIRGIEQQIDTPNCTVVGGLSGDHREWVRMTEFCGTEVLQDSLPVLYLFGDIKASCGIASGWFPIGQPHQVTESDGHIVRRINDEPALDIYRHYWGEAPPDGCLGEYPVAVFRDGPQGAFQLRGALESDADEGWIRFAGDVPTGSLIQLTEVLPEGILSGSEESMRQALRSYPGEAPALALVFSCAARKWVLGTGAENEVSLLLRTMNQHERGELPMAGLYCFGEVAPPTLGARSQFHNETCVTVVLGR